MAEPAPLDWSGPEDPRNPWNWPLWKKVYHSVVPITIGLLCTFSSSIYPSGRSDFERDLGSSAELALAPFSLFLLGLSVGPMIAGPMSENLGRRAVYWTALPLSGLFTLGTGFAQNVATASVLRFFAGLFASPGLTIGTGSCADIWPPEQRSVPLSTYVTFVQSGSAFGPFIGGFVAEKKGWRWTQWTNLFALAFVLLLLVPFQETYKSQILKMSRRKERKQGLLDETGSKENFQEATPFATIMRSYVTQVLGRPLRLMTEPIVGLFDLYIAVSFGILNLFVAAFPNVFRETYGFHEGAVGLTFLGQIVGSAIGWGLLVAFNKVWYEPLSRRLLAEGKGRPSPEQRLLTGMIGAPMIPTSLFWFGWTARPSIHWISPVAAEALFACGNLLIFSCASLYFTDCYGARYGASAWSSNTALRYLLAAAFPLFADQMYQNLGIGWASSLLGFITLALVLIPWLFFLTGARLRRVSRFTSDE